METWLELAGTLDNVYTVYSDLNFKHIEGIKLHYQLLQKK